MVGLPELTPSTKSTVMTTKFLGYNHNEVINDGEMYEMENLTGDRYPLLTQRKARGITHFDQGGNTDPLTGIHGRDQLVFIRGDEVWYALTKVTGITVSTASNMLPKKIVSMGGYVCIWPDKVYFNTADLTDCGYMDRAWSGNGDDVGLCMCRVDGTNLDMETIEIGGSAPEDPTGGELWIDQSGENDVLRQYDSASREWVEVATTYVRISATGIGAGLREYDAVELQELAAADEESVKIKSQVDALNGTAIVYAAGDDFIVVAGLLSETQDALDSEKTVRVDRPIPDLDYICESNNRLWGCKYGMENGVFVNEIRASKLGDFRNWQCFMGLSTDSYTASVGTDGPFTGAVAQKGYPVFFKENCIHRVSGNTPGTFQIYTTMCRGCQIGSWRSVEVVNEAIYYKSRDGIMMYDGSMPTCVSTELGEELYSDARAGNLNGKYYISMKDSSAVWQLFVYDTKKSLWFREDNLHALDFGTVEDELYCIDEDNNTLIAINGSMGETEEDIEWSATFGLFGTDYTNTKYLSRFNIRIQIEPGTRVELAIEYDSDGHWRKMGSMTGRNLKTHMIPVVPRRCDHLRFRLKGNGQCRIYSISRMLEVGGDG